MTIDVAALGEADVIAQALQLDPTLRPDELVNVTNLAQGNPLFVEEVVASKGDLTPLSTFELAGRLHDLEPAAALVLRVGALEPRPLETAVLARVLEIDLVRVESALDQAAQLGLVEVTTSGRWRFHHELVRRAAAQVMPPTRRARFHTRWANALADLRSHTDDAANLAAIAFHHRAAGASRTAFLASVKAARASAPMGGANETFGQWLAALEVINASPDSATEPERCEVLASALLINLTWPVQSELLDTDAAIPGTMSVGRRHLHRAFRVGANYILGTRLDEPFTVDEAQAMISEIGAMEPSMLSLAGSNFLLYACHFLACESGFSLYADERLAAYDLVVRFGSGVPIYALGGIDFVAGWYDLVYWGPDNVDERLDRSRERVQRHLHGNQTELADALSSLAWDLNDRGSLREAVSVAQQTLSLVPSEDEAHWRSTSGVLLGALYRLGRWDETAETWPRLTALSPQVGAHLQGQAYRFLLEVNRSAFRFDDALLDVLGARSEGDDMMATTRRDIAGFVRALVAERAEDFATARREITPVLNSKFLHNSFIPLDAITCAARLSWKSPNPGRAYLDLVRAKADDIMTQPGIEQAWRREVEAHLTSVEAADTEMWLAAVEAWDVLEVPFQAAQCRVRAAAAALSGGDRDLAADALASALEASIQLGAKPLERDIRRLAGHARMPLASPLGDAEHSNQQSGGSLTPREQEVLQLLAQGMTNLQIGRTLFMSPRTASVHVSHILAKLGAANRTEVAAVAHGQGLITSPGT